MKPRIHAIGGTVAIVLVATFMLATIVSELLLDDAAVLTTKTAILYALPLLVAGVMVAGASGRALAGGRRSPVLRRKRRRTVAVALVGVFVLVPCAFGLHDLAADGDFGTAFVVLQTVELVGGAANLTLLVLNARAGRIMAAVRPPDPARG